VALIEGTISFLCAMTPTMYNGSCSKALEATSMKISVGENVSEPTDIEACERVFNQANPKQSDVLACAKSKTVTTTEISAKDQMSAAENKAQKLALGQAYDTLGKTTVDGIGSAAFLYNTYTTKKLTFEIPHAIICDTIHADVSPNSYGVKLQWNFK
jgi:hypothetical protein